MQNEDSNLGQEPGETAEPQAQPPEIPAPMPSVAESEPEAVEQDPPIEIGQNPNLTNDAPEAAKAPKLDRFKKWLIGHKKISIPAAFLVLLIILFAVPLTRYDLSGLIIRKTITVKVEDSVTHTPVSGAVVSSGQVSALTDGTGKATLKHLKPGPKSINVSKKYYKDQSLNFSVPVIKSDAAASTNIVATGRQVSINVTNSIDGSVLAAVDIKIAGTTAKTDKSGRAVVVVPADSASQAASFSLAGYNNQTANVTVDQNKVAVTAVKLTPAGKIYFLSNRSGKLDVLKSNLDGSSVQTVLAGTGNEQTNQSSFAPSPDWKYIALVLKRSASDATAQLYVLSTADDQLLSVDAGNANFSVVGWSGDNLAYTLTRTDLNAWDTGKNKLKSYDATTGKMTQLDQTTGDAGSQGYQTYAGTFICGSTVVFGKNWYQNSSSSTTTQQPTLESINVNGQNHKTLATYNSGDYLSYVQHGVDDIYIDQQTGSGENFFDYTAPSAGPKKIDLSTSDFYSGANTFYVSPSGNQTMWGEQRDGKTAILLADQDGNNSSVVANLDGYSPIGWFSDKYLILTKNNNELDIISAHGGTPQKIANYQAVNFY